MLLPISYTISNPSNVIVAKGMKSFNNVGDAIDGIEKVEVIGDANVVRDGLVAGQVGFRTGYYI